MKKYGLLLVIVISIVLITILISDNREAQPFIDESNIHQQLSILSVVEDDIGEETNDQSKDKLLCHTISPKIDELVVSPEMLTLIRGEIGQKFQALVNTYQLTNRTDQYRALSALDPLRINQALQDTIAIYPAVDVDLLRESAQIVSPDTVSKIIAFANQRDKRQLIDFLQSLDIEKRKLITSKKVSLVASLLKKASIEDFIFIFDGFLALRYELSILDLVDAFMLRVSLDKLKLLNSYSSSLMHTIFDFGKSKSSNAISFSLVHSRIDAANFFLGEDVNPNTNLYRGSSLDSLAYFPMHIDADYLRFLRALIQKGYYALKLDSPTMLRRKLIRVYGEEFKQNLRDDEYLFYVELPEQLKNAIVSAQQSILNRFVAHDKDLDSAKVKPCATLFFKKVREYILDNETITVASFDFIRDGENEALEVYSLYLKGVYDEEVTFKLLNEINTFAAKKVISIILDRHSEDYYASITQQRESEEVFSKYNDIFWAVSNDELSSAVTTIQSIPTLSDDEKDDLFVEVLITTDKSHDLVFDTILKDGRISENNVIQLIRTNQVNNIKRLIDSGILDINWTNSSTRNLLWNAIDMESTQTVELLIAEGVAFSSQVEGDLDALDKALLAAVENAKYKEVASKLIADGATLTNSHEQLIKMIQVEDPSFESVQTQ